jgi:hypothetical protein
MPENDKKAKSLQHFVASGASLFEIAIRLAQAEAATKAPSVNKITWAQAGQITEPGRYMFKFGWLTVTAEIWQSGSSIRRPPSRWFQSIQARMLFDVGSLP